MKPSITVVSLKGSERRNGNISKVLLQQGQGFQYFDAIDGYNDKSLTKHFIFRPSFFSPAYRYREKSISNLEIACTLSHFLAIKRHYDAGTKDPLLVFEDDTIPCNLDFDLFELVLKRIPDNAATVQFAITPPETIDAMANSVIKHGSLFLQKNGPYSLRISDEIFPCHCTAAYFISHEAIEWIARSWFDEEKVIFPCAENLLSENAALLADQLLFQAATSNGLHSYACAVPLFTTAAEESTLHPDHIEGHKVARDCALNWNKRLGSRIRSVLS